MKKKRSHNVHEGSTIQAPSSDRSRSDLNCPPNMIPNEESKPIKDKSKKKGKKGDKENIAIYNQQMIMNNPMNNQMSMGMNQMGMGLSMGSGMGMGMGMGMGGVGMGMGGVGMGMGMGSGDYANRGALPVNAQLINNLPFGNPYQELATAVSARITQLTEPMEALTGCELANRFLVNITDQTGFEKMLFYCNEISSFCMKNCCPAKDRPFNMEIKNVLNPMVATNLTMYGQAIPAFIMLDKEFYCTCCCCNRPVLMVMTPDKKQTIGKIIEPCTCCSPEFVCYDDKEKVRFTINLNCCQVGFLFCKFADVNCEIYKENDYTKQEGQLTKLFSCMEAVTNAGCWIMNFPPSATPTDKILLIIACIFMDYRYYEESSSEGCQASGGRGGRLGGLGNRRRRRRF